MVVSFFRGFNGISQYNESLWRTMFFLKTPIQSDTKLIEKRRFIQKNVSEMLD